MIYLNDKFNYCFYITDHLGNNRVVAKANGNLRQVNDYYPFGGLMGDNVNGDAQRYKYNGKELDRMNGLDWMDYGARMYDGGRFTTVDPLAEKYKEISPYVYCKDNPVKYIDPDGRKVQLVVRQLNPYIPMCIAAHTFIIVSKAGEHPISYTYGPHNTIGGKLERTSYNYDNQIREGKKTDVNYQIIDVPIPKGMTEKEFDNNVDKAAKQFEGNSEINYNILSFSNKTGNCNTSTSTLLKKAGLSDKEIKKIKNNIKGNAYGFGQTRPWTKDERKQMVNKKKNSN